MAAGYSIVEVMFVVGLVATLSGVAVPQMLAALDDFRATGAARYMAARLQRARMEAVMRSAEVAVKFMSVELAKPYMKGAYRVVELDAGHWLAQEQPGRVADEVLTHLRAHPL